MNPQSIATKANANHFGHSATNPAPTGSTKNRSSAPVKSLAETPVNNGHSHSGVKPDETNEGAKLNHAVPLPQASGESASNEQLKETVFRLDAPSAKEVFLAAEFTNWDKAPIKLIKGGGGVWHVKVPLAQGRHLYRFIVDGEWQDEPGHVERVPNAFGTFNSVIDVF